MRYLPPRVAAFLITFGAVLRVGTLDWHSLWLDETFDIWVATSHTAVQIWSTQVDPNEPSLYYWLLHHVFAILGTSAPAARLLSAVGSVAGIGLVYLLARTLAPATPLGRTAATLLALAPLDFWYAQEARMHGLVAPAGALLALGLCVDRWWSASLVAAGLAFGLSIDHTMWPVAIVIVSAWLVQWTQRRDIKSALRVAAGMLLGLWIYSPTWPQALDVYARLDTVTVFSNLRRAFGVDTLKFVPLPMAILALTLVCALMFWGGRRVVRDERWRLRMEFAVFVGFLAATALSVVPRAYGLKQVVVGIWPLVTLAGAWSVIALEWRREAGSQPEPRPWYRHPAPVAVLISLCATFATFATPRADWRGVAAYVTGQADLPPGQRVVVLDPGYNNLPFGYYAPGYPVVAGFVGTVDNLRSRFPEVKEACLVAQRFGRTLPTSPSEAWLDRNLELVSTRAFARLEVRCYRVPLER